VYETKKEKARTRRRGLLERSGRRRGASKFLLRETEALNLRGHVHHTRRR
jgi:hypothetical protein